MYHILCKSSYCIGATGHHTKLVAAWEVRPRQHKMGEALIANYAFPKPLTVDLVLYVFNVHPPLQRVGVADDNLLK